jgi:hypothetical protein
LERLVERTFAASEIMFGTGIVSLITRARRFGVYLTMMGAGRRLIFPALNGSVSDELHGMSQALTSFVNNIDTIDEDCGGIARPRGVIDPPLFRPLVT